MATRKPTPVTSSTGPIAFKPVADAATTLPGTALIDGEIVVLDKVGRPSFQALQAALKDGGNLQFFAFDLLEQNGEDLTALPTIERKQRLSALLKDVPPPLHYADHVVGAGEKLLQGLCGEGYEGIVSKRADAPYKGRRTKDWLKIKCTRRQEFVIVGWTSSDKGRGFRSLLLGLNEGGTLRYAGKVGTGFNQDAIGDLSARLAKLARETPTVEAPRAAVRNAHWVEPTLVAEVAFAEFTAEQVLRHASFLGLREDKPADAVVAEKPTPTPKAKAPDEFAGVHITNPDRVIDPEARITKGDLAAYYAALAGPLLEWLADRPVSLVRCPQGRAKHCFFQKHDAGSFGDAVKHVPIREKDGHDEPYLYLDDSRGVLTCVQMGAIEFHGWGSKIADVEKPDRLVFDLDPDEGLGFEEVKRAAVQLRDELADLGVITFPMLSGGQGHPRRRAARCVGRVARGQELRRSLQPRDLGGAPGAVHRQHEEGRAQGPHLPRLAAQPARRDRDPALRRPRPRRRSGRRAGHLGRARQDRHRRSLDDRRSGRAAQARRLEGAQGLGRGGPAPAGPVAAARANTASNIAGVNTRVFWL